MPLKDDLHKFVDSHIQEIRYVIYGVGALGVILVFRDLRLATTFRHVSDIPTKFVTSHVTLQGLVQEVSGSGALHVCHQPVVSLPFSTWLHRLRSGTQDTGTLTVELAGVEMTPKAAQWLSQHTTGQHVWFTLLQASPHSVLCSVYKKKNLLFKLHLNKAVVEQGLAPVCIDLGLTSSMGEGGDTHTPTPTPTTAALLSRLLVAQTRAQKRHLGMWGREEEEEVAEGVGGGGDGRKSGPPSSSLWRRALGWLGARMGRRRRKGKEEAGAEE
ncbi:protein C3orf33 homolog [Babylonia areolata]|uniref:protein C3orf33 homolog n=1 Tax=Babylonia areolata TaxID=304850 RepID=UPI003FD2AF69